MIIVDGTTWVDFTFPLTINPVNLAISVTHLISYLSHLITVPLVLFILIFVLLSICNLISYYLSPIVVILTYPEIGATCFVIVYSYLILSIIITLYVIIIVVV